MSERPPEGPYTQMGLIQQEEKAFQKFAALRLANEDMVSIPKIYYDMVDGDHPAAAILDEILFWTLPSKKTGRPGLRVRRDGVLWLVVSRSDWWDRKRLTERQADRGIDRLVELGLVEKCVHRYGGHGQMHLRVIGKKYFELYGKVLHETYLQDTENVNVDSLREIDDLYAMMNGSNSPFGELRNSESRNGDSNSPNGDTNNILHHPPKEDDDHAQVPVDAEFGKICTGWQSLHGLLTQPTSLFLGELLDDWRKHLRLLPAGHPNFTPSAAEVILAACKITAGEATNPRSQAYTKRILENWMANGYGWKPAKKQYAQGPKYPGGTKNAQTSLAPERNTACTPSDLAIARDIIKKRKSRPTPAPV